MPNVHDLCEFLERFAPARLAEDWDNVGLLVGRREANVERVMTCLTVTPERVAEAVDERVGLIVTHHPMPFRALKRLTEESTPGRILLDLIGAGVAVYSPHTAFDSASAGINRRLAEGLRLTDIAALTPIADDPDSLGAGRVGRVSPAASLAEMANRLRSFLAIDGLQPDVGHEVLWVIRDVLSGEVLLARSLLSSTQDDLAKLLHEVKGALPVPIAGVVSDGQTSIRNATVTCGIQRSAAWTRAAKRSTACFAGRSPNAACRSWALA